MKALILSVGFLLAVPLAAQFTELPVVYQPEGMDGIQTISKIYHKKGEQELRVDFYLPTGWEAKQALPAVVFDNGVGSPQLLEWRVYKDWGRLVALRGMIGINYAATEGEADTRTLFQWLQAHGAEIGIDPTRLGIWTCSGNAQTGLPLIMKSELAGLRCAVVLYGNSSEAFPMRRDLPVMVVRAGRDIFELNRHIDQFVASALDADIDLELVNYLDGHHAFDIVDKSPRSTVVIKQVLDFLHFRLLEAEPRG